MIEDGEFGDDEDSGKHVERLLKGTDLDHDGVFRSVS